MSVDFYGLHGVISDTIELSAKIRSWEKKDGETYAMNTRKDIYIDTTVKTTENFIKPIYTYIYIYIYIYIYCGI
jgi:hypothetical protein